MISKLDLYKTFSQVAKSGSISKAAKDLYMTQPAVSQAIRQLEKELDTRLFNRTPKGVTLTNEGQLLFEYAHSAINLLEVGEKKVLEFKNLTTGELKIGVGDTISRYFLLPSLEYFHNQYPNIKLKMVNGTTIELCALLKSGEIDIAICNLPIEDPDFEIRPCLDVQDIFVCGEKFAKLFPKPISFQELVRYPLIFLEPNSISRKYVEDYLSARGISLEPEFELGSHDLLLEFARINFGIACVTEQFSEEYLREGVVYQVPLKEQIPKRSIGVCSLKRVALSSAANKFVEIIEEK